MHECPDSCAQLTRFDADTNRALGLVLQVEWDEYVLHPPIPTLESRSCHRRCADVCPPLLATGSASTCGCCSVCRYASRSCLGIACPSVTRRRVADRRRCLGFVARSMRVRMKHAQCHDALATPIPATDPCCLCVCCSIRHGQVSRGCRHRCAQLSTQCKLSSCRSSVSPFVCSQLRRRHRDRVVRRGPFCPIERDARQSTHTQLHY